ncbi:hypothetical protein QE152_g29813 [Popillia japonica]|uniref:Uncharacterized protein n=1 Tax=Popillia japonica TaxID=7064 RepID=A0AAW1JGI7_POPJA
MTEGRQREPYLNQCSSIFSTSQKCYLQYRIKKNKDCLNKARNLRSDIYLLSNDKFGEDLKRNWLSELAIGEVLTCIIRYKPVIEHITSNLTYGFAVWATAPITSVEVLEKLQNMTLRMMANAPWFMKNTQLRRDLQTEPLRDHLRSLARSTMERALRSSNPLILQVVVPQD